MRVGKVGRASLSRGNYDGPIGAAQVDMKQVDIGMCFISAVQPRRILTNMAEQSTGASSNMPTCIDLIINIFFLQIWVSIIVPSWLLWAWTVVSDSLSRDDCL